MGDVEMTINSTLVDLHDEEVRPPAKTMAAKIKHKGFQMCFIRQFQK